MVHSRISCGKNDARGSLTLGYDILRRGQANEAIDQEIIILDMLMPKKFVGASNLKNIEKENTTVRAGKILRFVNCNSGNVHSLALSCAVLGADCRVMFCTIVC